MLLGVALAVAALAVPAVIVLRSGGEEPAVAAAPTPSASPSASAFVARSPEPGDPPEIEMAWAGERITEQLAVLNTAMHSGDLARFVSVTQDKGVRGELERRFRSLRAMRVSGFELRIERGPWVLKTVDGRPDWGVTIAVDHCFVVPGCDPEKVSIDMTWRETPAGFRMTRISAVQLTKNTPMPWEATTLVAAIGSRAMVAAPAAYASRARSFLPAAERAAKTADKYVLGPKPDRYIVYLAGAAEWKKWFGGGNADWVAGIALPVTTNRSDIVLRIDAVPGGYAEEIMKHEMGHVATLAGRDYRLIYDFRWWLSEGVAEYIEWDGRGLGAYDGRSDVRRFIREKRYAGDLDQLGPGDKTPDWQVSAHYGLGFYATRCIADQYGHAKLMAFTDAVLRGGRSPADESPTSLGAPWKTVSKKCLAYTKKAVGA
ncbi:hypothetical protein SAMN05421812_10586 [Asanoa hainanensis]|uniref:Peptidase MA superfamily protein n=1 Tax=Asanoa hainanensis TaxID=560556 RepID=A0A239M3I7_9ACTN|nr:hypothetical protein SAMN05421812_10586 [Asanoa hainanensis]